MWLNIFTVFSFCFLLLFPCSNCFSQAKEEKEERPLEVVEQLNHKPNMQLGLFSGYDSNVNLDGKRKGDGFQEFLFYLKFKKPLKKGLEFNMRYALDYLNYNEFSDASSLLNRLIFEINKQISIFKIGTGYDFSYLFYPNYEEGDFYFHKGFFYIGNNLTEKIYHQLKVCYGIKDYLDGKAQADTLGSFQEKDRLDRRQQLEYSLKYNYNRDLTVRLKGGYSVNNSNDRYLDYYDYKSPEVSCGFDYKIKPNLYLLLDYSYQRKNYKGRTVTSQTYKQEDNLYSANLGFLYFVNKRNALSVKYTYRENASNDSLSEYAENVITCGWQRYF
ncbi:MAG: outer membrane beta-barrel protein [Candidatus Omnitrophota bacterium]